MRECIYCGRQLEKGEQCQCASSVAKRREREAREAEERAAQPKSAKEKRAEARDAKKRENDRKKEEKRNERERAKRARAAQWNNAYNSYNGIRKNAFSNVWRQIKSFLKSPVETIMNPGDMTMAEILILVVIEGIISGWCVYSVVTGVSRGPLRLLGNLLGFRGVQGYNMVLGWGTSALSGAIGGVVSFFLYSAAFYAVSRWILKNRIPFIEFEKRFSFVAIPVTIIGAVGVILGFFSQTTFAVLLLCGLAGTVILTYEVLRSMWYSASPAKTMYSMLLGMFLFLTVALYIVRLSV